MAMATNGKSPCWRDSCQGLSNPSRCPGFWASQKSLAGIRPPPCSCAGYDGARCGKRSERSCAPGRFVPEPDPVLCRDDAPGSPQAKLCPLGENSCSIKVLTEGKFEVRDGSGRFVDARFWRQLGVVRNVLLRSGASGSHFQARGWGQIHPSEEWRWRAYMHDHPVTEGGGLTRWL